MYWFHLLLFVFNYFLHLHHIHAQSIVPQDPLCRQPLGLESKKILDGQMKTDENSVASGKEGHYARLNNKESWCIPHIPGSVDVFRKTVFLEIDLLQAKKITAIALQGFNRYGYGERIQIEYDIDGGGFVKMDDLEVGNKNGDEIEYVELQTPIYPARKIRIRLQSGANNKCLRMELYGCDETRRELEYYKCPSTNNEIMTNRLQTTSTETYITESSFSQSSALYNGVKLMFSEPYAWCVQKSNEPVSEYEEYAEIDLRDEYLIYSLQVDGFRQKTGVASANFITDSFKLQYALDFNGKKIWAFYNGGLATATKPYTNVQLSITPPMASKYIRIYMRVNSTETTCIKLQLFGCKASLTPGTVPTSQFTNNTNFTTTTLSPTPTKKARILFYNVPQGQEYSNGIIWKDTKYGSGGIETVDKQLVNGRGCLVDGAHAGSTNPLKTPECWLGWNRTTVPNPVIVLQLSFKTSITGLVIRAYIDENFSASSIKKFSIFYSNYYDSPFKILGYTCAPSSFYHVSPRVVDYEIKLEINAQFIQVKMEYSGQWILIRQVTLKQDPVSSTAFQLSSNTIRCEVPEQQPRTNGDDDNSSKIIIIVCIVLGLLLFAVLAFLIYHYRTSLHKKFKTQPNGKAALIMTTPYDKRGSDSIHYVPNNKIKYGKMKGKPMHATEPLVEIEDVYAAPEIITSSQNSLLSNDGPQYAQYNIITDSNPSIYAAPNSKQYAEPNHSDAIYQSSAIYASTYENPYKAVTSSSLVYADPSKVSTHQRSVRTFPREQLSFKEKIGVGQFGEVHIAEATGLDDIYGSIGHYNNSWGLPDTADVAVKVLKADDEVIEEEFLKEVEIMAQLKHENVVRLLGVCDDKPMIMVCEYMENGDLNQFLRARQPVDEQNIRASMLPANALLLDSLLHMAQQIAAGMKYLHAEGFIHRDLATRNCLVGPAYQVKIADFGLSRSLYSKQYYRVEGKAVLPIRWMAPECLYYGKFTNQTDVWSFGVTLWEIFSFARETPYQDLEDVQIIEAACESVQCKDLEFINLDQPLHCPREVYEIMINCWQKDIDKRPQFAYLNKRFIDLSSSSEGEI